FERLKGRHTAINILNEFNKVIKFYELESKLVRIVTDNASNNTAAFDNIRLPGFDEYFNEDGDVHDSDDEEDNQQSNHKDELTKDKSEKNSSIDDLPDNDFSYFANISTNEHLRIPCFAHTLQLVVHDGLNNSKSSTTALAKVAAIAKFSHKSSIFTDRLENIKLSIPTANETRWNSQFYTLKAVYNIPHGELNMILNDLKKPELILSSTDKTVLMEFIQLLELFEEATMDAQGENHATISCVAPFDSQDTRRDIGKETLTDTNKEQQTSDAAYSPVCGKRKLSKLFPYLENPSKRILNIKSTVSEELENFGKEQRMDNDLILTKHQSYPHLSKLALKYFTVIKK
ncbi:unnamed protein product, partial [Didymodactylos carnosus]